MNDMICIPRAALDLDTGPLRALVELASVDSATLLEGVGAAARAAGVRERRLYRYVGALEDAGLLRRGDDGELVLTWREESATVEAAEEPPPGDGGLVEQLRAEVAELGRHFAVEKRRREEAFDDIEERLDSVEGDVAALLQLAEPDLEETVETVEQAPPERSVPSPEALKMRERLARAEALEQRLSSQQTDALVALARAGRAGLRHDEHSVTTWRTVADGLLEAKVFSTQTAQSMVRRGYATREGRVLKLSEEMVERLVPDLEDLRQLDMWALMTQGAIKAASSAVPESRRVDGSILIRDLVDTGLVTLEAIQEHAEALERSGDVTFTHPRARGDLPGVDLPSRRDGVTGGFFVALKCG